MANGIDSELRLQRIFQQTASCRQESALTNNVLAQITGIRGCHGDSRLQDMLENDAALGMLGIRAKGEIGEILGKVNPRLLGDEDGCNIRILEEVVAQRVIGGVLFHNEQLTPVKAGILATATKPGDPRIREIINKSLDMGGFDWAVVQALQL